MIAKIPTKLLYISKPEEEIKKTLLRPTFISDQDNPKSINAGQDWAEGPYYCKTENMGGIEKTTYFNNPIENVRINSYEERGRGGRAYKAIIRDKYYIDLREDVLFDTIMEKGIDRGGILRGKFIFAVIGSQMKLIRFGSSLHKEVMKVDKLRDNKRIPIKDLVVGGMYSGKSGKTAVYLGKANCLHFTFSGIQYGKGRRKPKITSSNVRVIKNKMLWWEMDIYGSINLKNKAMLDSAYDDLKDHTWMVVLKNSHSYNNLIGHFPVEIGIDISIPIIRAYPTVRGDNFYKSIYSTNAYSHLFGPIECDIYFDVNEKIILSEEWFKDISDSFAEPISFLEEYRDVGV